MHHNDPNTNKNTMKYMDVAPMTGVKLKKSQKFGIHFLPRNQSVIMKLMKIVLKEYVNSLN